MRTEFHFVLAALSAALACTSPAIAADGDTGYSITGANQSRANYSYLTVDSVAAKLRPAIAAQVPAPATGRLVILNVNFRAARDPDKMVQLDPADLQVQWTADGARGAAPLLGVHFAKESISWAGGGGAFTSMRPDKYEMVAIVPRSARAVDLALRQADGSFKIVKPNIALSAPK